MAELFLGVDGGQSSTTALIGEASGRVLGRGVGGPCNHVGAALGREKLLRTVRECVTQACEQAGLSFRSVRFRAACFGMSGGPEDKQAILQELLPTDLLVVTNDAAIALAGAMAGGPGIIVIAGTGSIAFGRNASGAAARAGGWGYVFGDEGGAFDLVRQALRAALRFEEGWGPPTLLHRALLDATGARDANAVLHLFYTADWPRARCATLASTVDAVAEQGDDVARSLLQNAAQGLAVLAASIEHQLWPEGEAVPVAYIGGVFRSRILLERFRSLVELQEGARCIAPTLGPAAGALLEAYRSAGVSPDLHDLLSSEF